MLPALRFLLFVNCKGRRFSCEALTLQQLPPSDFIFLSFLSNVRFSVLTTMAFTQKIHVLISFYLVLIQWAWSFIPYSTDYQITGSLHIYPKDISFYQKDTGSTLFAAAPFITARYRKRPRCLWKDEWMEKIRYIDKTEYNSAIFLKKWNHEILR